MERTVRDLRPSRRIVPTRTLIPMPHCTAPVPVPHPRPAGGCGPRRLARVLLLAVLCVGAPPSAWAQRDPGKAVTQHRHDSWNREDGLPADWVLGAVRTRDGYLWVGTSAGLARFDGVRFVPYDRGNTPAFTSNLLRPLLEDRQGALWIVSTGGRLVRHAGGRFTAFEPGEELPPGGIAALSESGDGVLYGVASLGSLWRFRGSRWEAVPVSGMPTAPASLLLADRRGTLWIGTAGAGLVAVRGGKAATYGAGEGLPAPTVTALLEDAAGTVWVGTPAGLVRVRGDRLEPAGGVSEPLSVVALAQTPDGGLWIGTAGRGVFRLRDGRLEGFGTEDGLSSGAVQVIRPDREGNVWVGTRGGLDRLRDVAFASFGPREGLATEAPGPVLPSGSGSGGVWVAPVAGGLLRFAAGASTPQATAALGAARITSLAPARGGGLWAGRAGTGLSRVRPGGVETYTARDGLPADVVTSVLEDRGGVVWAGTVAGLGRLEGGRWRTLGAGEGLPSSTVYALLEDRSGALWVGTRGGLGRLEDRRVTARYTAAEGLADSAVYSLFQDRTGGVWAGTLSGLHRVQGDSVVALGARAGLRDDMLLGMAEDGSGHLWLAYLGGVLRADLRELTDVAAGRRRSVAAASYGALDGLRSAETPPLAQPAVARAADGRIWLSTGAGIAAIDPAELDRAAPSAPARIERVLAGGRSFALDGGAELPPRTERLEVQYTGLSLATPERVRFRYRLEGFDRGWVEAGGRRTATYTNLAPGSYRFRVMAGIPGGRWAEAGSGVALRVLPAWYQTGWFAALAAAALLAAAYGVYLLRRRQLERRFALVLAERTRMAGEIHDTLIQGLSGVAMQVQGAARRLATAPASAPQVAETLREVVERASRAGAEARRAVWDLRAPSLEGRSLPEAVAAAAQDRAAPSPAQVVFRTVGIPRAVTDEAGTQLLRITEEAVANAVRHGGANRIEVELAFDPGAVRLRVRDDGCGFVAGAAEPAGHWGLVGMRQRAERVQGVLSVRSAPGEGTEVAAEVPA